MDAANAIAETKYSRFSYRKREDMNVINKIVTRKC